MKIDIDKLTEEQLVDLNHRIVARLKFLREARSHSAMLAFRIGDRMTFKPEGRSPLIGIVTKYNRKTVTVITDGGEHWNVSPTFLQNAAAQSAQNSSGNVVPIKREQAPSTAYAAPCVADVAGQVLVRYATPTDWFPAYQTYRREILQGRFKYNDRYVRPDHPLGPAPIPCDTRRFGVTYAVARAHDFRQETYRARMEWRHSDAPLTCHECDAHVVLEFSTGEGLKVVSAGLRSQEGIRKNGKYTFMASTRTGELVRADFLMQGCG